MSSHHDETLPGDGVEALASARPLPAAGDFLGRYEIRSELGYGAMGTVFRARDPQLDRDVALKVLRTPDDDSDLAERYKMRLRREARALASLHHPNVVTIYDVSEEDSRLFLAMELVEGRTLRQWLDESEPELPKVVRAYALAARGLQAAHAQGVIHRDFKPDNVMVERADSPEPRVLVMDFGLARVDLNSIPQEVTGSNSAAPLLDPEELDVGELLTRGTHTKMAGTPAYMAPERLRRAPADPLTDQFSFCVSLYEAVYGRRPFSGGTVGALTSAVMHGRRDAEGAEEEGPAWIRAIVLRGLKRDPGERWPTMAALADALEATKKPRRHRRPLLLVGGGLVAAGVTAFALTGRDESSCKKDWSWLGDAWNAPRKAAVEAAFRRSSAPFADQSWDLVRKRLDAYAAQWIEQRVSVCRELQAEEDTAAASDNLLRCLERRRASMEELVVLLADADDELIIRSVEAVTGLASPAECSTAALTNVPALPSDPRQREAIATARRQLVRAQALEAAGRYADAKVVVQELGELSERVEYSPIVIEVALARGRLADYSGNYPAAKKHLEAAYFGAVEAGDHRAAHEAALLLLRVEGWKQFRPEQGKKWANHSLAEARRLEGDLPRARTESLMALMQMETDDFDGAIRLQERVIEVFDRETPHDALSRARAREALAITQIRAGRHEDGLRNALQARAISGSVLGDKHPHVGVLGTNIGAALMRLGRAEEALAELERAIEIMGPDHGNTGSAMHNLGAILLELGRHDEAARVLQEARGVLEKLHGPEHPSVLATRSAAGLALVRVDPPAAIEELAGVLESQQRALGEDHSKVAITLTALAEAQLAARRWEDALASARRARTMTEKTLGAEHPLVAETRIRAALAHEGLQQFERAGEEARAAKKLAASTDPEAEAKARFVLGRALAHQGQPSARMYVEEAARLFESRGRTDELARARAWLAEN